MKEATKAIGHLIRMDTNRLVSKVWVEIVRAAGRPRWIYSNREADDLGKGG